MIEHKNGKIFDFDDVEIRTSNFLVESPNYKHSLIDIEEKIGTSHNGSKIQARRITCSFVSISSSRETSSLLRDEIFEMLRSETPFYLTEKRSTNKRWLVVVDSYLIPTSNYLGQFEVNFIALEGVAKSKKTTQDIQKEGLINDDSWSFGMGLETVDDSELIYTHVGKTFKIFNAGNVEIHPFESYLKIDIKSVIGASSSFELVNRTNNSRFKITKAVDSSEVWRINGPVILRNSLNATRDTDKTFISLEPGWNQFEILGANSANVSFDFNYLYL